MSVIYIVMPIAFIMAASAVVAFIWAARRGQFDDMETPRWRVLFDDTPDKQTSDADQIPESQETCTADSSPSKLPDHES